MLNQDPAAKVGPFSGMQAKTMEVVVCSDGFAESMKALFGRMLGGGENIIPVGCNSGFHRAVTCTYIGEDIRERIL